MGSSLAPEFEISENSKPEGSLGTDSSLQGFAILPGTRHIATHEIFPIS